MGVEAKHINHRPQLTESSERRYDKLTESQKITAELAMSVQIFGQFLADAKSELPWLRVKEKHGARDKDIITRHVLGLLDTHQAMESCKKKISTQLGRTNSLLIKSCKEHPRET